MKSESDSSESTAAAATRSFRVHSITPSRECAWQYWRSCGWGTADFARPFSKCWTAERARDERLVVPSSKPQKRTGGKRSMTGRLPDENAARAFALAMRRRMHLQVRQQTVSFRDEARLTREATLTEFFAHGGPERRCQIRATPSHLRSAVYRNREHRFGSRSPPLDSTCTNSTQYHVHRCGRRDVLRHPVSQLQQVLINKKVLACAK